MSVSDPPPHSDSPLLSTPALVRHPPSWIALGYAGLAALWIFLSDRILEQFGLAPQVVTRMQTMKGWFFVVVSAALLYFVLSLLQRRNAETLRMLVGRENQIRRLNAELERRVALRTEQLEATNRELEAFAYAVSHDLRAPLRSLSGFSQLLQESGTETLDDKSRHYLQRIHDASGRMSLLIEDLLSLSRISRSELTPREVNLSQLAEDAARAVRERYPDRSVEFIVEPDMTVTGDPRLLRIALDNLIDNAWKYTKHTHAPRVEFGIRAGERERVFHITDNGAGFDMAYSGKLFGPFQRLHPESQYPGTGIGLVTVQRILARHGGRIWAQAALNKGASFSFTIDGLPSANG